MTCNLQCAMCERYEKPADMGKKGSTGIVERRYPRLKAKKNKHITEINLILHNKLLKLRNKIFFKKKVNCNVCGWSGIAFNAAGGGKYPVRYNAFCPRCASAERHREFIKFIEENKIIRPGSRLLELGPNKGFVQYFKNKGVRYFAIGLHPGQIDCKMDARNMGFREKQFDYVLSSHVLSFIKDDLRVMHEMYRVLHNRGLCVIIEPHDPSRETTIEFDKESEDGTRDNVRKYGTDIVGRLESVGFTVKTVHAVSTEYERKRYGLYKEGYTFFFCQKNNGNYDRESLPDN